MEKKIEVYLLAAENPVGKKQRRIFKRKRAGEVLTREQVKAIKQGRRLLKKEMKEWDLKTKEDFELMATSMGLYFDKHPFLAWLRWLFHGRGLWMLLGGLAALMAVLFGYSVVTQLQGHFTINMSTGLFREGFVLSDNVEFRNPTTNLFCTAAENVPCISISQIPLDIDTIDGQHNANYFAYTFYIRNEGDSTVGYDWYVRLNSESKDLSTATWVMIFEDGEMMLYAEMGEDGQPEAIPEYGDNTRGYMDLQLPGLARDPEAQFEEIAHNGYVSHYRVVPYPFATENIVARGRMESVEPQEVHKYTVVIWLEGDDPDCTDEMIGGHAGMDFNFKMFTEEEESGVGEGGDRSLDWETIWDNLIFWDD